MAPRVLLLKQLVCKYRQQLILDFLNKEKQKHNMNNFKLRPKTAIRIQSLGLSTHKIFYFSEKSKNKPQVALVHY